MHSSKVFPTLHMSAANVAGENSSESAWEISQCPEHVSEKLQLRDTSAPSGASDTDLRHCMLNQKPFTTPSVVQNEQFR